MKAYLLAIIAILLVIFISIYSIYMKPSATRPTKATSTEALVSTQSDWQAGTLTNIDSASSPGGIKMDNKAGFEQSLSGVSVSSQGSSAGSPSSLFDNPSCNTVFTYQGSDIDPGVKTLTFDLGEVMQGVFGVLNYSFAPEHTYAYSSDGVQWATVGLGSGSYSKCDPSGSLVDVTLPFSGRYLKMTIPIDTPSSQWAKFRLFQQSSKHIATNDGTSNFWSWDSFNPTQTVPANTSVTYRYRTSSTGSDWTSWTSNFASVTSRSGDTKYRYLQVEATLANTDSTSTPTIDQYDIGYHTEIKPSAPTAQTATIQ